MRRAAVLWVAAMSLNGLSSCGGDIEVGEETEVTKQSLEGNTTLKYVPPGTFATAEATITTATRQTVSLFYPRAGQDPNGLCWLGLTIDRAGNLFPVGGAGDFSKLDPSGNLIRGKDDQNFFVTGGNSNWGTLDQNVQRFFTAALTTVRSAPYRSGAKFSVFASGLKTAGEAVAIGRGPLAGSLLVTDTGASRVYRVTLNPVSVKLFASGSLLRVPEAIASAPDGTVYVVNVGSTTDPAGRTLLKITTGGSARVFASAASSDTAARRMLAVDDAGTVYWSNARGIDRFRPDGSRLKPLPLPQDRPAFENPMGAAFDGQGNLYVVENFGCKRIYKYVAP
jgi:hypothetical protein